MLLLVHAIVDASPASAPSTSHKGNEQRNKKAFSVSQSPITYVKRLENLAHQPEAKMVISSGGRPLKSQQQQQQRRLKGKKILDNKPSASSRKSTKSNHELLSSLGLSKLPSPSNHHRKRLATQSRHVGIPDY